MKRFEANEQPDSSEFIGSLRFHTSVFMLFQFLHTWNNIIYVSFFILVGWLCVAKCGSQWFCLPFLWWRLREFREAGTIQIPKASSVGKPSRSPLSWLVQRSELWFPLAGFYRDTESSITPKPFPDKPNDVITDDILHCKLVLKFLFLLMPLSYQNVLGKKCL